MFCATNNRIHTITLRATGLQEVADGRGEENHPLDARRATRVQPAEGLRREGPREEHGRVQEALRRVREGSRGLLGRTGEMHRMVQEMGHGARRAQGPLREMVLRRHDEHLLQLPRPPPQDARRQDRPHLGRRAAHRFEEVHVQGAPPRGLQVRERAQVARHQEGRSRQPVPPDDPRARHRDARLHAHRRDPFDRIRRLQRRVSQGPHHRRRREDARHERRQLPPRQGRGAQGRGGRDPRRMPDDRARDRREAHGARRHDDRGQGLLVARRDDQGRRRLRSGARRGRGHLLHPLHERHDGQAEGRRSHDGRLSHVRDDDEQAHLRSPRG